MPKQVLKKHRTKPLFILAITFSALLFTAVCLQTGNAEEAPLSFRAKKMTMSFTRSMDEHSGRWTYLVFSEAFKKIGLELVYKVYPPNRASALADDGMLDGELGRIYSYKDTHPNLVRVEEPITTVSWVAYTLSPIVKVDGWESLKDTHYKVEYRTGLAKSKNRLSALISKENLSSVSSVSSGLKKLAAGRTDIYVDIEETVAPYLESNEFKDLKIRKAGILEEETLHAYLHKKNKSYASDLSNALRTMKQDGLFEAYQAVVSKEIGALSVMSKLMNGGFEEIKEGKIKYWEFQGPEESFLVDGDNYLEGKNSIQIHLRQPFKDGVRLQQEVEVEAGKRYDFGGKIKVNLKDGLAEIVVVFLDKNRNEIKRHTLPKLINNNDWVYQNIWIKSPNGVDMAKIMCVAKGKGQAWFDDLHFTTKIRGGY